MSTIKGAWKINSVGDVTSLIEQEITFTSGSRSFARIQVFTGSVALHDADGEAVFMVFNEGVLDTTYQTVDFGETEQEVSDEFYTWLTTNATRVEDTETEDPGTGDTESGDSGTGDTGSGDTESSGLYISEIEMKNGTVYAIKDAEARAAIEKINKDIVGALEGDY